MAGGVTTMSPDLIAFLKAWYHWATNGAPHRDPFSRHCGLCGNTLKIRLPGPRWRLWDELSALLYGVEYPFGERDYVERLFQGTQHECPKRLAWVRERLIEAGEDELHRNKMLASMIVELLNMVPRVRSKAGDVIVRRARRAIEGLPDAVAQGEANYQAYRLAFLDENKPDGTLTSLVTVATMLDEYGIKALPANEQGQVDFMRAIMESAVDEIRAFLANQSAALNARQSGGEVDAGEIEA